MKGSKKWIYLRIIPLVCRQSAPQWALVPYTDPWTVPGLAPGWLRCWFGSSLFLCHRQHGPKKRNQVLQTGNLGKAAGLGLQVRTCVQPVAPALNSQSHGNETFTLILIQRPHFQRSDGGVDTRSGGCPSQIHCYIPHSLHSQNRWHEAHHTGHWCRCQNEGTFWFASLNIFQSTSCDAFTFMASFSPAASSKPSPELAGYPTGLCALHTIIPGIHGVGDGWYPQSVKLHSSSPEGEATAAVLCESLCFSLIGESSLLYVNYCSSCAVRGL